MSASFPATILVVEDEPSQRESMKILLAKYGNVVAFGHPKAALEFLKSNHVDAAVVDIRMPGLEVDGLWFLKEAREYDSVLGIVLRTGDSDIAIAQAGIEARAVHRIVKGDRDSVRDLKSAVENAIFETRERRALNKSGNVADQAKAQLYQAISRTDRDHMVTNLCLGFTRDLTPKMTALGGFTARLAALAEKSTDTEIKDVAAKLVATSESLRKHFTDFQTNPFLEASAGKRTPTCNGACAALSQSFKADPDYAGLNILTILGQTIDANIGCNPIVVLTILRHLVGFFRSRLKDGGTISLSWESCASARNFIERRREDIYLTDSTALGCECAVFSIEGKIGGPELRIIKEASQEIPETNKSGKLSLATNLANSERLILSASNKGFHTEIRLFIPQR